MFGFLRGKGRTAPAALSRAGSARERHALALEHGYNGLSFLTLYPGWEYFHPAEGAGYIAYERHNGVALAVGDPICDPTDTATIAAAFRAYCAAERLTPSFVGATPRFADAAREAGWKTLKIGEEPIFDLADYAPRGNRTKKVRSAANQARKSGVTVEAVAAGEWPARGLAREIEEVQSAWQRSRNVSALAFTLRLSPLEHAADKVVLTARLNGRVEAFVTCIPAPGSNSFYIEDMIRRPDAPNGVSEMLFLAAVEECRARGALNANLGLAPLRNTRSQPSGHRLIGHALQFTFNRLNLFYKFKPLEHFKAKFGPSRWEDSFLVYRPGRLPRVGIALLNAFTPGKLGPVTTAISRFKTPDAAGERRWSPRHAAGMVASAGVAVAYSAVALQHPAMFLPFDVAAHVFAFPFKEGAEEARAHLVIDTLLLAGAGGWYARSARRD